MGENRSIFGRTELVAMGLQIALCDHQQLVFFLSLSALLSD